MPMTFRLLPRPLPMASPASAAYKRCRECCRLKERRRTALTRGAARQQWEAVGSSRVPDTAFLSRPPDAMTGQRILSGTDSAVTRHISLNILSHIDSRDSNQP